ncbi:MAG: T9SS type A sorting domain-containing protein [Lewinellaceae bacterium]|nr:T9SS type A sorting domain-containing protein [Lewinellaceae bacterium]
MLAQCSPDSTPPTAVCDLFNFVYVNSFGPNTGRISAATLNDASTDNCTPTNQLLFRITTDPGLTTPPTTTVVDLVGAPNDEIETFLWVGDEAGNWSTCSAPIILLAPKCSPDTEAPYLVIPPDLTFSRAEYDLFDIDYFNMPDDQPKVRAAFGEAYHWDNCDNGNSDLQESYYLTGPLDSLTRVERRFFVTDAANNQATVVAQYITILDGFTVGLPAWQYPGETVTDTVTIVSNNPMESVTSDIYYLAPCFETPNDGYLRLVRTWGIIDWAYTPFGGDPVVLPALDLNNDGRVGDPYEIIAIGDSIWLYQNNIPTQNLGKRATVYEYNQEFLNEQLLVTGTVFLDTTGNCSQDPGERVLAGWKVKGIGQPSNVVYTAITDGDGVYALNVCPQDTLVEVSLDVPGNVAGGCPATFDVVVASGAPGVQHIPAILNNECDLLSVDIATGNMRPCFAGAYTVSYCNLGGTAVADTYIDVALDTFVQYTSASLPGTLQSGNTYRFETGDLAAGECGQFSIAFLLDCDAPNGLTHCSEAAIFPTADCPPIGGVWQGAELRVQGHCEVDSVRLEIRNIGSGDMGGALNFIVTEDLIMAKEESYQLDAGAMHTLRVPANGATWRIETPQEPGHPWGGIVARAVEGCGGLNQPGLVNVFPINNPNPFVSTFCRENTSSFDPNDKQAYPLGYGNEHFIKRNTDIEYMIRFQNTGTDTAFTVVLLDTLSTFLNAASVRPGAASHTYDFDLLENNVLRFRFDNILLPDSNVNEAASHGFVKFRIQQQPDNPIGTVIQNSAAIYFDFNAPVITNTTRHTIGDKFVLTVSTDNPGNQAGRLLVYPNPATESATFELPDADPSRRFVLVDDLGKTVVTSPFAENTYRFERGLLPPGIYFFQILAKDGRLFSGKIVLR